jgi:hypothetical protein
MQPQRDRGRRRRRRSRKFGVYVFLACCLAGVLALVVFIMYYLTSMNWRLRR